MGKTTVAELEKQVALLTAALEGMGWNISQPLPTRPEDMPDYVPFGSPRHADLLGIVAVEEGSDLPEGVPTYKSRVTDKTWRLLDPFSPFMGQPNPLTQAQMVLQNQVHVLDAGPPKVHDNAPELWNPPPMAQ